LFSAHQRVWLRDYLNASNIKKRFEGKLGGVGLPGGLLFYCIDYSWNVLHLAGGGSWGTLFYDNISDLSGSCDIQINATPVATNVNFIHNGKTFATVGGFFAIYVRESYSCLSLPFGIYST
jgi:hypothetical protein